MAILPECSNCGRKGGYAESPEDEICARCKMLEQMKDEPEKEEEEEK